MKYVKPILLCMITGVLMGFFLYSGYEGKKDILPVFAEGKKVTFFRLGIFDNEEAMEKNTTQVTNYIYLIKDNKYYVYIGMCSEEESKNKIKGFFQKKGYMVDEESFTIDHKEYLTVLQKYEEMLKGTNDDTVIENIVNGILLKYEEMVTHT